MTLSQVYLVYATRPVTGVGRLQDDLWTEFKGFSCQTQPIPADPLQGTYGKKVG